MRNMSKIIAGFEALPAADIAMVLQGRRPLILAPHADDESLGCGGLIAAACAAGLAPVVVVLTDGSASHPGSKTWPPAQLAQLREQEAGNATSLLGLPPEHLHFLRQRDSALAREGEAVKALVERVSSFGQAQGCTLLIGPWQGDPHCDHEAGALLAAAVAKRCGWKLLSYPVWGWLREEDIEFEETRQAGWRLNIADQLQLKKQAIAAHQSQYGDLIMDSPEGFRLPENLLAVFFRPFEVFIA